MGSLMGSLQRSFLFDSCGERRASGSELERGLSKRFERTSASLLLAIAKR
jgi:hypothetical protein